MSLRKHTHKTRSPLTIPPLRVVIVGHVDHGKSTLIGRLLYDTDSLADGKYEALVKTCEARNLPVLEWSFLLDSFQAERDQAITIDTTRIPFQTDHRPYEIIDAPGHREFLKNMISGAAAADAAILVVDAVDGVQEQTRRHAYLLKLLGLRQVGVVVNKIDAVGYDTLKFEAVARQAAAYLKELGVTATSIVPISARQGDMIAHRGENMPWYEGKTVTELLDRFEPIAEPLARPMRFPVQDVYRWDDKNRILVGRVESGILRSGDEILFSPTNERAKITNLAVWPDDPLKVEAKAGEVIGLTLDQPIFVERGHMGAHVKSPPVLSDVFRVNLFWVGHKPLERGKTYKIRMATLETSVVIQSIDKIIDTNDLKNRTAAAAVHKNQVAEVTLRATSPIPLDSIFDNIKTGRVVVYDGHDLSGGGTVSMEGYPDQRSMPASPKSDNITKVDHLLGDQSRAQRLNQKGGVFWFTGLSGSGKSTLSMAVERALFEKGYVTYVLDGDNVRHGLNADLGFSPEDRAENIRRIGHVAALMADAGLICITAFISPYKSDRIRARNAAKGMFHEIYIDADLETCESRDPKGLYKKARSGQIKEFTGIDSPYESPDTPELRIDTSANSIDISVQKIIDYIEAHVKL